MSTTILHRSIAFYETIKDAIDIPTKEVINDCAKNVSAGRLQEMDVNVLKLLYLFALCK